MSKLIKDLGTFKFKSEKSIKDYVGAETFNISRLKFAEFLVSNNLRDSAFNIRIVESKDYYLNDIEVVFENGMVFTDADLDYYIFNLENNATRLNPVMLTYICPAELNLSHGIVVDSPIITKADAKALIIKLLDFIEK
ncbi:hypothetical protein KNT81_gp153 [Proteus phage phiP4-3]|uniref:Uncharacterized protein n=1 Tax=Proteus phage phiP4-3 TaxID=2065203 RepID=A0A2I6PFW3_9CAUD|nr:hypothetical protein KNT81_gp153 [Proteus phage phiP4-3]AUM58618.1 hypothetical protein phiP43_260 [Proteus phage phiP4-3]AZV01143.1 hypothetical protein vBSdyM006_06 [Shigella phage vB_SdyM_006]